MDQRDIWGGRLEDDRLLRGEGRFCDDVAAPDAAWAVLVRSPHAHAEILSLDVSEAKRAPGVLGLFTSADLAADELGPIPCMEPIIGKNGSETIVPSFPALAEQRVRYVGQPVALVVAETQSQARDAAELVEVDYRDLPSVTETARALDPDVPQIWPEAPSNLSVEWEMGDADAVATIFKQAAHRVEITLVNSRITINPLEPRAAIGEFDTESGRLTLTTPGQGVHSMRTQLAEHIFKLPEDRIRVITPDVGGGFGGRVYCNGEQVLTLWAARRLNRTVRWTADRSESFFTDGQGRDHVSTAALALDTEGRILALRVSTIANMGAYVIHYGPTIPASFGSEALSGSYHIPEIHAEIKCVFTNTVPIDAYRGTGRAEAAYLIERLVDTAARDLGLSPVEFRRRNFITPEQMPYNTATGVTYDSGDFAAVMERALDQADWENVEQRKQAARADGRLLGVGVCSYATTASGGLDECARLRLDEDGGLTVFIGTQSTGQGHVTPYCQLVTERLGVPGHLVRVRQGDSDEVPTGGGTNFSRSLLMGGLAIKGAADALIEKARDVAAHLMQADGSALIFDEAAFAVSGSGQRIFLAEIGQAVAEQHDPAWNTPIETCYTAEAAAYTFPNGCHVCELLVDPDTGVVAVRNYAAVDDCGRVQSAALCEGQIKGGVVQGLGQALLERVVFEPESGQLLSGSLMDYCLPRADDVPFFRMALVEDTPCETNPMGVKGAGEIGAMGAPAAVMNALIDALSPLGIDHFDMPATPERVWRAIREAPKAFADLR